jgi:hypothetical protein
MKHIRRAGLCLPFAIVCALAPAAHAGSFAYLRALENPFLTSFLTASQPVDRVHHVTRRPQRHRQVQPFPPRATPSYYIHTVKPKIFRVLGCLTGGMATRDRFRRSTTARWPSSGRGSAESSPADSTVHPTSPA